MNVTPVKLDKRRKYYLILDCETCTLPFANKYDEMGSAVKQKVSIAKPLIYDIGWTIVDKQGNIYDRKSFVISEIFSSPVVFNTGYYRNKRPIYIERIRAGKIQIVNWQTAMETLIADMEKVEGVGAYNSMFDFKKAIPFTELYISKAYDADLDSWLNYQERICDRIAVSPGYNSDSAFEPDVFRFHEKEYSLFDVWGMACNHILNNDDYKRFCLANNLFSPSGKYFTTSAENAFRFCAQDVDFEEEHTALSDAEIESYIFGLCMKKAKTFEPGIIYFPFKVLGLVEEFNS